MNEITIYAVHSDGGAPMNETALCRDHLDHSDLFYGDALIADDRPDEITWTAVTHPERNDTTCRACLTEPAASPI